MDPIQEELEFLFFRLNLADDLYAAGELDATGHEAEVLSAVLAAKDNLGIAQAIPQDVLDKFIVEAAMHRVWIDEASPR